MTQTEKHNGTQGDLVRIAREEAGLTQTELANEVGTFQQTIDKIERNIVKHSRYLPKICRRLGVDLDAFHPEAEARATPSPDQRLVGERDLPVHGAAQGGDGALVISTEPVDFVRRPAPLAQAKDGYGVIIVGESMSPEFKPGDISLVHPHLPPIPGEACVFYSDDGEGTVLATIKSFIRSTANHWHVEQWNPPKKFTLARKDWQRCHRIVGKYSRR